LPARVWGLVLLIAAVAVFGALLLRDHELYPSVFADEWAYSTASRLLPFANSPLPNYAYLGVYSLTNVCGEGFLACARVINAAAFVAATPFIYLTARRVCTRGVATLLTVLALLGPINTYTAYFMPEALYFLAFWAFAWFILGLDSSSDRRKWAVAGILLGGVTLVKPHGLFLIPAVLLYTIFVGRAGGRTRLLTGVVNGVVAISTALVVKFAVGSLLAGGAGLTLFGARYTSLAMSALSDPGPPRQLLAVSALSLLGHLLTVCLILGLPAALAIAATLRRLRSTCDVPAATLRMSAFAFLILGDLVLVVAIFTASLSAVGPVDFATRIHMRYYDFALPLLYVVAAAHLGVAATAEARPWRLAVAVPVGLAIGYALATGLGQYAPILVDSPELRGLTTYPIALVALGVVSLAALAAWACGTPWGVRLFVYGLLPTSVMVMSYAASTELRARVVPNEVDLAGTFVGERLTDDERSRVLVVGSEPADLFRALFYIDDAEASLLVIPVGSSYDLSTLPEGKDWAFIIGEHAWTGGVLAETPTLGTALVRREQP